MNILGIDYGRSKIGLAIGDTKTGLVEPLKTVKNFRLLTVAFEALIKTHKIEKIVVGLPGGTLDLEIKEFGKQLQRETGLPVDFIDESLTSKDAQRLLIETKKKRKARHYLEDAFAAAIMLEFYLRR